MRKLKNLLVGNLLRTEGKEWNILPRGRSRMLPNLEAADEVMSSQQLKNNGPQGVIICSPVQGKDIKAPEVQVL
jgi:hypothetical protein